MATQGGIGQRILLARVNGENLWFRALVNLVLIVACVARLPLTPEEVGDADGKAVE